jgi:hypothetical protein
MEKYLEIRYTTSKARDTCGWNVVTLIDGNKRYQTCGGGYDMIGTVFGDWLQANFYDKLKALNPSEYYGLFRSKQYKPEYEKLWLDGGCGLSSITTIAEAIGLNVKTIYKGQVTAGFIITQ